MSFDEIDIPHERRRRCRGCICMSSARQPHRLDRRRPEGGRAKVPVEVAASGPKVIAMSALHAERVMFTLGADVERLAWGIALAKKTRKDAGLDPDAIAFGAYVNLGCHSDVARRAAWCAAASRPSRASR